LRLGANSAHSTIRQRAEQVSQASCSPAVAGNFRHAKTPVWMDGMICCVLRCARTACDCRFPVGKGQEALSWIQSTQEFPGQPRCKTQPSQDCEGSSVCYQLKHSIEARELFRGQFTLDQLRSIRIIEQARFLVKPAAAPADFLPPGPYAAKFCGETRH